MINVQKYVRAFGPRCSDFHENCASCQAWLLYDVLHNKPRPDVVFVRSSFFQRLIEKPTPDDIEEAKEILLLAGVK